MVRRRATERGRELRRPSRRRRQEEPGRAQVGGNAASDGVTPTSTSTARHRPSRPPWAIWASKKMASSRSTCRRSPSCRSRCSSVPGSVRYTPSSSPASRRTRSSPATATSARKPRSARNGKRTRHAPRSRSRYPPSSSTDWGRATRRNWARTSTTTGRWSSGSPGRRCRQSRGRRSIRSFTSTRR